MKISYITAANIPSKWAHSIQVMKMAQAFQQLGHNVNLIASCEIKNWNYNVKEEIWEHYGITSPFKITRLPLNWLIQKENKYKLGFFSYAYISAQLSKLKKVDLVFARNYLAPYWSAKMGIPTIAETHAAPDNSYQKQKLYEAAKLKSFKGLVTISEILAERYVEYGVPKEKIIVRQDGVDLSIFSNVDEEKVSEIRGELLNGLKSIAVYAGHLYDYKGIPYILEAAKNLPDVSFVLVGGWPEDIESVRERVVEAKLKNINLIGFVPNSKIPLYLKAADVLLLPYTRRHSQASTTSPLKLFEYMASEKPIVASAITNVTSVLKNSHNAILVSPDHAGSLENGINKILHSKDLAQCLADRAATDIKKYLWTKRVKDILEFAYLQ